MGGGESDAVFEDGELVRYTQYRYPCRFGTAIDGRCALQDVTRHTSHACRLVVEDVSSERIICRRPLQRDPYESLRVYVAAAPGKGEGLFAKIALEKGEVVAFYNGGTAAAA